MFDALLLTDRQVTTRLEAPKQIWTYKKDFLAQLGGERLKVQEQVGRRPKRGGAAFASVDIWALWGLELGA